MNTQPGHSRLRSGELFLKKANLLISAGIATIAASLFFFVLVYASFSDAASILSAIVFWAAVAFLSFRRLQKKS